MIFGDLAINDVFCNDLGEKVDPTIVCCRHALDNEEALPAYRRAFWSGREKVRM